MISMSLDYSPFFVEDLKSIKAYVSINDALAASKLVNAIYIDTKRLADFPLSCGLLQNRFVKKLRLPYRYLVSNGYYVIYRIENNSVKIHRAISCSQNFIKIIDLLNK